MVNVIEQGLDDLEVLVLYNLFSVKAIMQIKFKPVWRPTSPLQTSNCAGRKP